jgi:sigma-E factor negative regulatory protein RseC
VPTRPSATYGVGDEVQVVLKASMGFKAVWIAYFLPLVVLLAIALGLIALGVPELVSGLAGLGAVALYYLVVWLLRDRLRNEYVFTIQA